MIIFQTSYSLPGGDQPLTHSRIAHSLNWLSGGTISASSTAAGYFDTAPNNSLTYERWKPSALAATWEYDHGSASNCDYCVIAAHNMGMNGNTLQIQYWNGSSWTGVIPSTAITSDEPIMAIFGLQNRQRWRIQVSNGTAPEIGFIKFGRALQMDRPMYAGHSPLSLARQTMLRANYSETGEFLGRTKQRVMLATEFAWQHLSRTFIYGAWRTFQRATESEPFVIAWRPDNYPDVGFCQLDAVPIPQTMGVRDLFTVSMQVRALAYD